MLKTLLRRQLFEINRSFFYDAKKSEARSRGAAATYITLYVLLMTVVMGDMSAGLGILLCRPLFTANMGWLYFTIFGMLGLMLGVFGSVFNTYAGLYLARDNDLLLSMPIPVKYILASRLLGVYLMSLMFSGVITLPGAIVYFAVVPVGAAAITGSLVFIILVSLISFILSAALGWVVAKISVKLKNKSVVTVLISLAFIGIYYFAYFKANAAIKYLVEHAAAVGGRIKSSAYPIYAFGRIGEGDMPALLIFTAATVALLLAVCLLISRSFIKIATSSGRVSQAVYKEKKAVARPQRSALLAKEIGRFTSSPTYMLNCGLGILLLPIAAIAALINSATINDIAAALNIGGGAAVIAAAVLCMIASTIDISAPSLSLEGKSLWIVRSLPVKFGDILKAKLRMHFVFAVPAVIIGSAALAIAIDCSVLGKLFIFILPLAFAFLSGCFGLFMNIKKPNFNWTSEITPIKQSMCVTVALFGGWGYSAIMGVGYFLVRRYISAEVYLGIATVITAALGILIYRNIVKSDAPEI